MRIGILGALVIIGIAFVILSCRSQQTIEERSPGEITFRRHCQTCHVLPRPSLKSDEEWPAIVQRYGQRAKLTREEVDLVIGYVTANN